MTQPDDGFDGQPNTTPVKTPPPAVRSIGRLTPRQLGAYGTVLVNTLLSQVALALTNVSIFGINPFGFLKGWADGLQDDALKAYRVATGVSDGIVDAVSATPAGPAQSFTDYVAAYNAAKNNVTTVKSAAATADGKAQGAIDGINQAVTGATGTGATAGTVATNITTVKNTATGAASDASSSLTKHTNLLTSLRGGYTIDIVNTTSTWNKPSGLSEIFVVCFGGGAKGSNGQLGTGATAQPGGDPGAVIAVQLDPKDVPATVSCTIGGNTSATPSKTSFGTLITTDDAFGGYVATPLGVILTGASPSKGGSGGLSSGNGASGATTTVGLTGGAGGAQNPSNNGSPGSAGKTGLVFAGNLCQTGGSGGGGGGGTSNSGFVGGNGGQGGFPGGGGGGGGNGAGSSPATSTGGNGGLGLIMVIYKLASNT